MKNLPLAINVTFVGLVVVFLSLIALAFIIYAFTKIVNSRRGSETAATREITDQSSILEIDEAEELISSDNNQSNEELIAVLTAAVMACMGSVPASGIKVRSFRRIPQTSPAWNVAGRNEQIWGKL